MANYNVDIAVALKGAQKLTAFNKDVKTTKLQVDGLNKTLKNIAKDQQLFIRSFENLNKVLGDAKVSFNAVASGTNMQKKAARELVAAENFEVDLRNSADYDGMKKGKNTAIRTVTEIRPRGSIIIFPSFVWHRVAPVTKGTRYSLVVWSLGYPFR